MHAIMRFESFLEGLVERSFARLFRARMQPVEIAKRLAREMEAGRIVGVSSVMVPNRYSVSLSDQDYAVFAPIRSSLEQEMARYLARFAYERGYATTAPPEVHIASDSTLRPRQIVVVGRLTEPPSQAVPSTEPLERTKMMPRMPSEAPPQGGATPTVAHLTLGETTYPLVGPDVALGRGLENTIVLEDRRVSRSHARLILAHGHWTVRDEGSTNGTFVNGRMVTQHALKNGDRLSLGGLELIFHQRRQGTQ
jgi:hypothetical protein